MKKSTVNAIVFAQASDNKKAVVSNKYVAHSVFAQNKPIWEALGGTRDEGVNEFRLVFKSEKKAKEFIAQAITSVSKSEYNKARKTEPKPKVEKKATVPAPTKAKGKVEYVTVTLDDGTKAKVKKSELAEVKAPAKKGKGNTKPTSAPNAKAKKSEKVAPRKSKGNADLTEAQKKALNLVKNSVLNRAASAYSIANGGEATTFKALGKSEKALEKYIPKAKADTLKSGKWEYAKKAGITEDMLGF